VDSSVTGSDVPVDSGKVAKTQTNRALAVRLLAAVTRSGERRRLIL